MFLSVLEKNAPLTKKTIRANHAPYMTKILRKTIMRRSFLKHKYYKNGTDESKRSYKKQKNYCSRLYKKERKNYYANLDLKNVTDNKLFWKTIKPFLSDKGPKCSKITLVQDQNIISEDQQVSETLNNFFKNAVASLKIDGNRLLLENTGDLSNPIEIAIKKFENHPSILNIKDNISLSSSFTFTQVTLSDIEKEIKNLHPKEASTFQNIPIKHLKETSNICSESLVNIWNNEVISKKLFPSELKLADITPILKKVMQHWLNTIDQIVFCQLFLKFTKDLCRNN